MSNNNNSPYTPTEFSLSRSSKLGSAEYRILLEVETLQGIPVMILKAFKTGWIQGVDTNINTALECIERISGISSKAPGMTEALREEALGIAWGVVGWLQEFSMANPVENCGGARGTTGKGSKTYSLDAMIDAGKEPEGGSWSYNDTV